MCAAHPKLNTSFFTAVDLLPMTQIGERDRLQFRVLHGQPQFHAARQPDHSAMIPYANIVAPNRMETTSASLCDSPHRRRPTSAVSRTPQPAIEIGAVEISMIGGMSRSELKKLNGAPTAWASHQAMAAVSNWLASESAMTANSPLGQKEFVQFHRELHEMARRPPAPRHPWQMAEQDECKSHGEATKPDQKERAAPNRIFHQYERPRQADDDEQRQRQDADEPVYQHRIGCRRPAAPRRARSQTRTASPPIVEASSAEKDRDGREFERTPDGQRSAAEDCDLFPAERQEECLHRDNRDRRRHPACVEPAQPVAENAKIRAADAK